MNIKELIKHLQCFDEDHHVIIKDENECRDTEKNIRNVKFDGRNCIIETDDY